MHINRLNVQNKETSVASVLAQLTMNILNRVKIRTASTKFSSQVHKNQTYVVDFTVKHN